MAVPTTVTDLSVTAASNSPAGADTVATNTGPDEYLRALGAILRREQAQATATASAASVDLGAIATGSYVHITGSTGPITSFGTVAAGVERTLVFDSTPTITHNATSLILLGGASRTAAAGDIGRYKSEGSGNWREIAWHPASGYQPLDADLTAIAALANTDGNFIVGNGSAWVAESGATARTSLGLGTAAVVNTGVAEGDVPLIDYGTFTPVLTFATAGNLSVVYSNQLGRYIKLGRLIIADIYMTTSTFTHTTASGGLQVTGFPVASENVSVYSSTGSISWQGITKAGYTSIAAVMSANTSTCVFVGSGSGVAVSDIAAADMPTGGNVILRFTISYLAAS